MITDDNYRIRNQKVFNDLEAILEKIVNGEVAVNIVLHNKRIVRIVVQGSKVSKYSKSANGSFEAQNTQACQDVVKRIGTSIERKESSLLQFQVELKSGVIQQNKWETKTELHYDK